MNVYVRELSREMGTRGYLIDVFTRRADARQPRRCLLQRERPRHSPAGRTAGDDWKGANSTVTSATSRTTCSPSSRPRGRSYDSFTATTGCPAWSVSALRERWGTPLVSMFHTLGEAEEARPRRQQRAARPHRSGATRGAAGGRHRLRQRAREARSSSISTKPTPSRIAVVPCGVDLDLFRPATRRPPVPPSVSTARG